MKKFVIGYIDSFDNNLELIQIEALNEENAVREVLEKKSFYFPDDEKYSLEELKEICFDSDSSIEVLEIIWFFKNFLI